MAKLTTAKANEIVFNNTRDELIRAGERLPYFIEQIKENKSEDFYKIGELAHQLMRNAYLLAGLKEVAWTVSESKRPETALEKQIRERHEHFDISRDYDELHY